MSLHQRQPYDEEFDDELNESGGSERNQRLTKQQQQRFNISDEDEVEEELSSSVTDETPSIASIARAAANLASNLAATAHIDEPGEAAAPSTRPQLGSDENLDDSLNEQMKEMHDYFKGQAGEEDNDEAPSSLNASNSNAPTENLATIMNDVLRINNASIATASSTNIEGKEAHAVPSSDHEEDSYDKIERSPIFKL